MKVTSNTIFKVLALALDNKTPGHHIEYLLKKMFGLDGLSLDRENTILYEKIKAIANDLHKLI